MKSTTHTPAVVSRYLEFEKELAELIPGFKFSDEIGLRLERMRHLLKLLDHPEQKFRALHVGGTSGKGSTATMSASILHSAGLRVGLHTSPHLQIINERHRINGRMASTTRLTELWPRVKAAIDQVKHTNRFGSPSYFEAQVALSLLLFAEENVEVGVIEVGLGGSIDPTNVVPAEIAILTSVGLDHTEILGDTIEKIMADKAGIIKRGQHVISGVWQPTAQQIISRRCQQKGARLWQIGREFRVSLRDHEHADFYLPGLSLEGVKIALQGDFQAQNAALAIMALRQLNHPAITEMAIRQGLAGVDLAGRVEIMQANPLVILDGAHNPDKIRASASLIERLGGSRRRVITVLGLKKGKDAAAIVPPVTRLSDELILTTFIQKGLWTAYDPEQLVQLVADERQDLPVSVIPDPLAALDTALARAKDDDIVLVTGSLYLVGDVRERWFPRDTLLTQLEK